jgi:hypothetical protein
MSTQPAEEDQRDAAEHTPLLRDRDTEDGVEEARPDSVKSWPARHATGILMGLCITAIVILLLLFVFFAGLFYLPIFHENIPRINRGRVAGPHGTFAHIL